jgi:catechol 2,3-dioxygenase-like lactoylglutathione lyase family enzyme
MPTIGICHNALYVRDLDKSLHFYRDLLGMMVYHQASEEGRGWKRRAAYLRWEGNDESFRLVLAEYLDQEYKNGGTQPTTMDHYSFWVDDIQEMYQRLTADGVKVWSEPRETDNKTYQPVYGFRYYSMFCTDPDGLPVQFEQRIEE